MVRIIADRNTAYLSTRGWPTANFVLWIGSRDVLDYEPEERILIENKLKDINTFWDIGSQIGYYSYLAKLYGVKNVLAVDINKYYCEELKKHANYNDMDIQIICSAVGISGKTVSFNNPFGTYKRKALSLDDLYEMTNKPDLIKIDIEGGEKNALLGGEKLLSLPDAPDLFIEFNKSLSNIEELIKILKRYGYKLKARGRMNFLWNKEK